MMTKGRVADLVARVGAGLRQALTGMQAGPRSTQSNTLNYLGVTTLDPTRLAAAFQLADMGMITDQASLFELIEEQNGHVFAELSKRRRAVTGLQWHLQAPRDASQSEMDRTAELEDMVRECAPFNDFRYDLTDAVGKGFAAIEIDWRLGDEWVPKGFRFEPQRNFQIDRDTGALMYLNMGLPEPLREWKWVVHRHKSKSGYLESQALFRVLGWLYAYKAYNQRDMQRFLELYGIPLRIGKYPSGLRKEDRDVLLRAVRNIGNDGAGVIPSTMEIDFIQAKEGSVGDFLDSVRYWESKESMAILGGTLTSQADGKTSTNALGTVHNEVRREIMLHDVEQIDPTVQDQVVNRISRLNGMFEPGREPRFEHDTAEPIDQAAMVNMLKVASGMGMRIGVEWAHEALQIPMAAEDAAVLRGGGGGPDGAAGAALARLAALARAAKDGDVTGAYAAQLAALCAPIEQAQVQRIAAELAQAGGFEEAIARIEALAVRPTDQAWVEALALGMSAANLAGRGDA